MKNQPFKEKGLRLRRHVQHHPAQANQIVVREAMDGIRLDPHVIEICSIPTAQIDEGEAQGSP